MGVLYGLRRAGEVLVRRDSSGSVVCHVKMFSKQQRGRTTVDAERGCHQLAYREEEHSASALYMSLSVFVFLVVVSLGTVQRFGS